MRFALNIHFIFAPNLINNCRTNFTNFENFLTKLYCNANIYENPAREESRLSRAGRHLLEDHICNRGLARARQAAEQDHVLRDCMLGPIITWIMTFDRMPEYETDDSAILAKQKRRLVFVSKIVYPNIKYLSNIDKEFNAINLFLLLDPH